MENNVRSFTCSDDMHKALKTFFDGNEYALITSSIDSRSGTKKAFCVLDCFKRKHYVAKSICYACELVDSITLENGKDYKCSNYLVYAPMWAVPWLY